MTNIVTVSTFSPVTSKNGKVSDRAYRIVRALSGASAGVQLALALHGSSSVKRTFATSVAVVSLEQLLTMPSIEGAQWPDVYAHLADKLGYVIEGGRGKAACRALVAYAQCNLNAAKLKADHDGISDAQHKTIQRNQALIDQCVAAFALWQSVADQQAANLTTEAPEALTA